jgi:hypothetical protein
VRDRAIGPPAIRTGICLVYGSILEWRHYELGEVAGIGPVTNEQLYLAMGVPILFNGILAILITTLFSARMSDMRDQIAAARSEFRELLAADRRAWDANLKHLLDKLDELDGRLARLEAK